jgi:two-component system sensor histidine kinase ResE
VEDTGKGIEPEDLPYVFERFYRGQGVGSSTLTGTGLGLALVKEIVDLHGGGIRVESELGEGSTFTVWLPLDARDELSTARN